MITSVRNFLYDRQIIKSVSFDTNVLVVGNLAIGGTGKTPMVEYLIEYFHKRNYNLCTLSRGYGRQSVGFRIAKSSDNAASLGDEPFMFYDKFKEHISVAVGGARDLAISEILGSKPETNIILMDDALQHRRVLGNLSIMLTTFDNPFYSDFLLPAGRLREARIGAKRAQITVVTKCPEYLSASDQVNIKSKISEYSDCQVFFSNIEYQPLQPFFSENNPLKKRVIGISGLANPSEFEKYLRKNFDVKLTFNYRDHYHYTQQDVTDIINELDKGETMLITTEKDMVKLREFESLRNFSCFYLPIKMKFLGNESLFVSTVENYLRKDAENLI